MRWLVVVAAAIVLAGCGSGTNAPGAAPIVANAAAPPIAAVDEAPPDDIAWFLKDEFGQAPPGPATTTTGTDQVQLCASSQGATCPPPSPEEQAKLAAGFQRFEELVRPA